MVCSTVASYSFSLRLLRMITLKVIVCYGSFSDVWAKRPVIYLMIAQIHLQSIELCCVSIITVRQQKMSRIERWVNASFATAQFEPFMVMTVQGLGRLDISLLGDDEFFLTDFENNRNSLDETLRLNERFTLSYLWVLGGYELVRCICQRIKESPVCIRDEVADSFSGLKREFNRLRIPLAKMEPSSARKNTDCHIAYPALCPSNGIAWQVARDVFITRRDLADKLLAALELARSKDPNLTILCGAVNNSSLNRDV